MGNLEIEIKASIANREEIKRKLEQKGAQFKTKKYQHDILLDPPTADFSKTDQVLRIRNTNGNWKLDYKSPRMDNETRARKEFSLTIEDGKQLKEIFAFMNFKIVGEIEKTRETYTLQHITIDLDSVTHLGDFIELEILGEEQNLEKHKKEIFQLLEELEIKEIIQKDYLELLWEKGFFKKTT